MKKEQNFSNHSQIVTGYHRILFPLLVVGFIGSIVNLIKSDHSTLYSASLITLLFLCISINYYYTRVFPLRAQDRAIKAEEALRYFQLTGKRLPNELRMSQIIALRFASDEEFVTLTDRAITENLGNKEIKKAIKSWKADFNRV